MFAVPYMPSFKCLNDNATEGSVVVAIQKPTTGLVDHYDITVTSNHIHEGDRKVQHENANAETVNATISGLRPYTDYAITVLSALKHHKERSEKSMTSCKTAEGSK